MPTVEQLRTRLIGKLRELFQLDQPDLDFGFWRIMHAKATQVTEFLENDLLKTVASAFGEQSASEAQQKLAQARDHAARELGGTAIAADGSLAEPFRETPAGKAYLAAQAQAELAADTAEAEAEVYDHLYRFFERYYEGGDFISRRYYTRETPGKAAPYAIPYNGEEVKLHWANADQYYIKTTEHFANFTFDLAQAKEVQEHEGELFAGTDGREPRRVHFGVVEATEGEHGNVKASEQTKRYFIIHEGQTIEFDEGGELVCHFEFRPDPEKTGQERTWREKRNAEAVESILGALDAMAEGTAQIAQVEADSPVGVAELAREYGRLLRVPAPTGTQSDRPLLARYVNQYTARNTMDYFIHKDLGGFLSRELDFYIKNEVMRLDDIESADAPRVEQYLSRIKVLRQIAGKLIDFLAQLEDFQKKLWLKKKFVVETHYCITLDRILAIEDEATRDGLLAQIAGNDAQRGEWVKLFAIDEIRGVTSSPDYSEPLTEGFLRANPNLVLDTRFFSGSFRFRLLSQFHTVQDDLAGELLASENLQALHLLSARLRRGVQCVYIDPPYNTDASAIIYKNNYKDSSWLSLLSSRVSASTAFMTEQGILCVAIDDIEFARLRLLLEEIFAAGRVLGVAAVRSNPAGRSTANDMSTAHEYAVFASSSPVACVGRLERSEEQKARYSLRDEKGNFEWVNFRKHGGEASKRSARPRMFYPLLAKDGKVRVPDMEWDGAKKQWRMTEEQGPDEEVVLPISSDGEQKRWKRGHESVRRQPGDYCARPDRDGKTGMYMKSRVKQEGMLPLTWWSKTEYSATDYGTNLLTRIFGEGYVFSFPKSVHLVKDCLRVCGLTPSGMVLDYFAGSGTTAHAVMALNREDKGRRKYVLVEMGDYFDSALKPRCLKCIYAPAWRDGKPKTRTQGISHLLKYVRLESYEDCLNNLELREDGARRELLSGDPAMREDYVLRYMLDVETRGSQSLLNVDGFTDPTAYKLKVKKPGSDEYEWKSVDLLETFNYLIGLRVEHIAAPQTFAADFERPPDPELPEDQRTRLAVKGRIRQDPDGPWWFRKVEGWVPKDPEHPNNGEREKVLIVWRKLPRLVEMGPEGLEYDNLMLDEWFQANRISTRDFEFDTIYVNGSNNLPNLKLEGDTWKVRLIEEDFMRLMWDVEDV